MVRRIPPPQAQYAAPLQHFLPFPATSSGLDTLMIFASLSGIMFKQRAAVSLVFGNDDLRYTTRRFGRRPGNLWRRRRHPAHDVDPGRHPGSAQALVDAYNASHKNHIDMTVVPTDDYQAKVGAAAAASGCRTCSRPTWCSCRTGPRRDSSRTSPAGSHAALCRRHRPGGDQVSHLAGQGVRPAVRRRPIRLDVQQEAVHAGRPRPEQATNHADRVRGRRPSRSASSAATSTAPSSAATAVAATCSPGGRSHGPTASRS